MKNADLDQLLQEIGKKADPEISPAFQQDVWREIRHRKAIQPLGWEDTLDSWLSQLLQPLPITVSLVLALLIGIAGAWPLQNKSTPALDLYAFNPRSANIQLSR
jgi:hypothetical protein